MRAMMQRKRFDVRKKQRIGMLKEEQEKMIRSVKIGNDEYYTLDEYEYEPQLESADDDVDADELWGDEDAYNFPMFLMRFGQIARWKLFQAHLNSGLTSLQMMKSAGCYSMNVLQMRCEFKGEVSGVLTTRFVTRFVYDWRWKDYDVGPSEPKGKR
eukprot:s2427_g6.t1